MLLENDALGWIPAHTCWQRERAIGGGGGGGSGGAGGGAGAGAESAMAAAMASDGGGERITAGAAGARLVQEELKVRHAATRSDAQ
jgi:hypothetical protein